ncbi:hypothetical protein J2X16_004835 [Pelomonas aquatica]|uniref:Uncharacterized protein n=1 Tax=Pelomonas aquatica TaxID=431058 RepID=A0ABU1ZFQ6_9BURK|nr:hypothetical protein [Pelomonas aquatica]
MVLNIGSEKYRAHIPFVVINPIRRNKSQLLDVEVRQVRGLGRPNGVMLQPCGKSLAHIERMGPNSATKSQKAASGVRQYNAITPLIAAPHEFDASAYQIRRESNEVIRSDKLPVRLQQLVRPPCFQPDRPLAGLAAVHIADTTDLVAKSVPVKGGHALCLTGGQNETFQRGAYRQHLWAPEAVRFRRRSPD